MNIKTVTIEELRRMKEHEGLVLQGCGGSLDEWVDGINEMLTESGILLNGSKFKPENCRTFVNDGCTCLLFPLSEDIKVDVGKLAMWRLSTHDTFGGTWLSDYVPNRLGGFISREKEVDAKPDCPLIGQDGNIFNLIGIASRTLKQNGMAEQAKEMSNRIYASDSYDRALGIIGEYVNITSIEDEKTEEGMGCGL